MPLSKKSITTETVEQAPVETTEQHIEVTETPDRVTTTTETEVPAHTEVTKDSTPRP